MLSCTCARALTRPAPLFRPMLLDLPASSMRTRSIIDARLNRRFSTELLNGMRVFEPLAYCCSNDLWLAKPSGARRPPLSIFTRSS